MAPQLSVELTGDEVKLFKSLQKIIGQQKKLEDGFGKVKKESDKAGKSAMQGFGSAAAGQLKNYVAGVATITTAWQVAQQALQHYQQEVQSAKDQTRGLADARRRLAQVGGGDAARVSELNRKADAAAVASGVERDVARNILFSAVSEGFESDFERILSFQPLINAEAAATVAGRGPGLFKGQISPLQAINATFAAAEQSNLGFEEIARALPIAAEGAALNKGDPTETIATLSVLAGRFKSADPAATAISTFLSKASLDERTSGQGVIDAVRTVRGMSDDDRSEFLGESKELNRAFKFLSEDLPQIEMRMRDISKAIESAGTDDSMVMQGVRSQFQGSPNFAAQIASDRARIQKEIFEETLLSERGFEIEAARDRVRAESLADGNQTAFDRFVGERLGDAAEFAGLDQRFVEGAQRSGGSNFRWLDPVSRNLRIANMVWGGEDDDKQERMVRALEGLERPPTQSRPDADR